MIRNTSLLKYSILSCIICLSLALVGCSSINTASDDAVDSKPSSGFADVVQYVDSHEVVELEADEPSVESPIVSTASAAHAFTPEWVDMLGIDPDVNQIIIVAGVGDTGAILGMYNRDENGVWQDVIITPAIVGEDGLGDADIEHSYTPIGTFTVGRAFGIAENPGCKVDYLQVDESYYWSGDAERQFNELVSLEDVPDLDLTESEHIIEVEDGYRYVLDIGYNREGVYDEGAAFFLHCFCGDEMSTEGCIAVSEDDMVEILRNLEPGCVIAIDTLDGFDCRILST